MYKKKEIPSVGFGTYKLRTAEEIDYSLTEALCNGYKMIDTAQLYKNEHLISNFLYNILPTLELNMTREDIWITSKVPYFTMLEGDEVKIRKGIEQSINLFGGYIDLYLIHASNPNDVLTWRLLREFQIAGKIKYVGISNYNLERLDNFIDRIGSEEAKHIYMNQIEFNPFLNRADLVKRCQNLDIRITAYGSLYKENEYIKSLSNKYNISSKQILLAWALGNDITVIPMSRKKEHIIENIESIKIKLEKDEINILNGFNENYTRFLKHL
jgi:diketogulonate reductase-like aldo/keto reductase